jgi:hypothetical protein
MENPDPSSSPEPASTEAIAWQALFEGGSPREILARLIDGDPLGLRARCEQRVHLQSLVLDVHRLQLRTVAHVARHAGVYCGAPPLDVWIAERIRKALSELLDEDDARRIDPGIPEVPCDPRLFVIARALGIEPEALARGQAAFNRSPYAVRSAFCALVVRGESPAAWATANGSSIDGAKTSLRRALWILGLRRDLDLDDLLAGLDEGDDDGG